MLRFCGKKLLSFSVKASAASEICNLSSVCLLRYHLSRYIANVTDASLAQSDLITYDHMTVSYLTSSCGLSPKAALSISKRFHLKSTENADAVLKLLKAYGFSDAHINTIITKKPRLLKIDTDRILKPKLEFLCSGGLNGDDLADILAANASLVNYRMDKIAWCFDFYSAALTNKSDVIQALKCTRYCLDSSCQAQYQKLKDHGVSDDVIVHLLKFYPNSLMRGEHLLDAVRMVKEMGFPPTCQNFARAVGVIASVTKDGLLRRVQLLCEMGWSYDEVLSMFRVMPTALSLSDENIRAKIKFYEEKIGWGSAVLSKHPNLLTMSLENKTVPRFLVLNQLMSKHLIPQKWRKLPFIISNQEFCRKYIEQYKDKAPGILKYFQGNTNLQSQN